MIYDDNYATCSRTYATLIIKYLDPSTITARLEIEPSESQIKGELIRPFSTRIAPMDGWFLCTKGRVESRDSRRHIDWLLDRIDGKAGEILRLQAEGCEMVVSCYWVSSCGQGGPTISPVQMRRLGELNIELCFDIYGPYVDYSEFTLESVARVLGVVSRSAELFPDLQPVPIPPWLKDTLERGTQGIQLSLISEKSRSEFIVVPLLLASRELSGNRFVIYSGQRLDVNAARGLMGECDFILSATAPMLPLQAPIATVVEAKKNDIEEGLGQCIAQMVAADRFNRNEGQDGRPVFGCVTTGEAWQFAKLAGSEVLLEPRRYYIDKVETILGAFRAIIDRCIGST